MSGHALIAVAFIAIVALPTQGTISPVKTLRVLFIGNSYTYVNDLPGTLKQVVKAAGNGFSLYTEQYAPGGATLGATPVAAVRALFNKKWDWVVLQDQSQIPGIPPGWRAHVQTVATETQLLGYFQGKVAATGAKALLYQTWGRLNGDRTMGGMYPDYPTMQTYTIQGYHRYLQYMKYTKDGVSVVNGTYNAHISPCGVAWKTVYQDIVAQRGNPLASKSVFARLFGGDAGGHPSALGQYFNALVFFARIFKTSPVGIKFTQGSATAAEFKYLQGVAANVSISYGDYETCFPSLSCAMYGSCSDNGACKCYKVTSGFQPCGNACDDSCRPTQVSAATSVMAGLHQMEFLELNTEEREFANGTDNITISGD